jgi:cytosine/adenosine deaminase-related metal-dependent hydrolase
LPPRLAMPDLVIRNARVYTLDRAVPWAEAVAIRYGRISWVGADGDAGDLVGPGTEVIDAGRRLVLPGSSTATTCSARLGQGLRAAYSQASQD